MYFAKFNFAVNAFECFVGKGDLGLLQIGRGFIIQSV